MIEKVVHNVFAGSRFLCIEVSFLEEGAHYHAIEVLQKNNALFIESSNSYDTFETLSAVIPKNRRTIVSFTGQGIISKKVPFSGNYRSKLLFNANAEDFYWYELPQADHVYASVVRKTIIDDELAAFKKEQISVVGLSIGPWVVSVIKQLLPQINSLYTKNFKLSFANDTLSTFEKTVNIGHGEVYEIDGEKIDQKSIVPFSGLINHLFPSEAIQFENDFLETNEEEFKFKKAFNTLGVIVMPFFLLTLLISYLMLGHYQNEYIQLQVVLEEESIAYNKLKLLEKDRDNKEAMLNESGLNDSYFLSHYLSEIANIVPPELNLNELGVFSPTAKVKPGQRIFFNNDQIEIKGTTTSNKAFTNWIKAMKQYTWVENLEIVDFQKEGNTNSFEIRLKLRFNV